MAALKTYKYRMDCDGKMHMYASALMGAAFFLRSAYYFGFTRLETVGAWNLIIFLILPMLLEVAFMVMIRGLKLDLVRVYGIMGAACCLLLMLQNFSSGGVLQIILSIPAYLVCGAALVGIGWGFLSKNLGVAVLLVTVIIRFLAFDLFGFVLRLRLVAFIREGAALCLILALVFLCAGLKERKRK